MFTILSTIYFLIGFGQVVLVCGSNCHYGYIGPLWSVFRNGDSRVTEKNRVTEVGISVNYHANSSMTTAEHIFTDSDQMPHNVFVMGAECGRPSDKVVSMRIVGGRRAEPHSFPWTVAILKNDRMHCGGAMITNKHVLSAGHCFKWDTFQTMEVLIGLDNLDDLKNVEKRNISQVVIHEHFTSTAVRDENDIALATLNQPVIFNDNIVPICLPKPGEDFTNRIGTIVGWGRIGVEKSSSKVLLKASLRILSDEDCMNSQLSQHLKPTMMCAFSKGKDGCQGDSGGPLLVFQPEGKYVQAGVVSWGIGCADPRYPGVYTKVSNYIDWIALHTTDGIRCNSL